MKGPAYFNFGSVVRVLEGSAYYGYFVANYERSNPRLSQIKRVSLTGGPAVVLTTSYSYTGVGDPATDGTSLFWTDEAGIRKMSIDGGAVQTLISGPAYSHISLDSGNVHYSSGTGIYKIAKSGGATTTIANAATNVTALYAWPVMPSTHSYSGASKVARFGVTVPLVCPSTPGKIRSQAA